MPTGNAGLRRHHTIVYHLRWCRLDAFLPAPAVAAAPAAVAVAVGWVTARETKRSTAQFLQHSSEAILSPNRNFRFQPHTRWPPYRSVSEESPVQFNGLTDGVCSVWDNKVG